ncbi:DNA topoisomerase III [Marinobacter halophilus]|uniref:DNA topoisomerase n=1 Tax=Marinobacter halophilus TaxID=1323740 RepID=A0A2T1KBY1_9GAMM|nr:DNA topoisomerase III [Marinobacter halophilus]PSF07626.1 DNA topoisomerase III [Marinobacter halophilus]GGC56193.1 DNA topoisomerase 3 [Marinobacter halophilus]
MHLYIAEKPSLARAIAAALPEPHQKGQGWIRCGQGKDAVTVSWCIGHLLEPAEPARYNQAWKKWRQEDLPMFPDPWQLTPKDSVKQQLSVLESLIRQATLITHAGDPDREGQLLVDEVLKFVGTQAPVKRILINDLTPKAVARAIQAPRDNKEFRRLSHSALARQRADWLYGINLTRFYTLVYQQQGEQGVYSVGRVQTPVLGLVVERDNTIEDFKAKPWFRIEGQFQASEDETDQSPFTARWLPGDGFQDHVDEENRLLSRDIAEQIVHEVNGRPGTITESRFRDRPEPPPLPLSLSALQIEAGRLFRMGAKDVLDTAQNLYERHQLITYPRSDCRYLPEEHFHQREQVIRAIGRVSGELEAFTGQLDISRRSAAWNDKQVDAHHAIVPTVRLKPSGKLSAAEQKIYSLISRYYLMQFAGDAVHREGKLTVKVQEHLFRATETAILTPGWRALELKLKEGKSEAEKPPLPRLEKREPVTCRSAEIKERKTQPPQHFTDSTLLSAMTNIARFVSAPELRKTLRDTDGLGTEATRAAIIDILFRRDYLYRDRRHIRATDKGKALIAALPDSIRTPDRTAVWEATLEGIRRGEDDPRLFLEALKGEIREVINRAPSPATKGHSASDSVSESSVHCPKCRAPMVAREGKFGRFFACTRYPNCKGTRPLEDSQPEDGTGQKPIPCPHCFSPLVRRQSKKGWFWGCSNFPTCRQTVNDVDGKPALPLRNST